MSKEEPKDHKAQEKRVLSDHRKKGKKFIPPFVHLLGGLKEVKWLDCILPELLWLGLLNDYHGLAKGAEIALVLAKTAAEVVNSPKKILFASTSIYSTLPEEQKYEILQSLKKTNLFNPLKEALVPFGVFYPECPLNFIFEDERPTLKNPQEEMRRFKEVLSTLFDRWESPGTFIQANAVYIAFVTDVLKVFEGLALANFPEIEKFPHTEESCRVASSCRATVNTFFGVPFYDSSSSWPGYFWNRGLELEKCEVNIKIESEKMETKEHVDETNTWDTLSNLVTDYIHTVRDELIERVKTWKIDFEHRETYEVIGALLARQVTLATQLAGSPSIWNGHIAPLILRTMTDNYINIAWILMEPLDRSRKFIRYGLGQEKLMIEHLKTEFENSGKNIKHDPSISRIEDWLNSQRFSFLTEVDVGGWSGIDTRTMAEEAGCLDLYRFAYTPFSAATHNMWHHVGKYNVDICLNPLHGYHRIPTDQPMDIDIDYLYRAAKYVEEVFRLFDNKILIKIDAPSAYALLSKALNKIGLTTTEEADAKTPENELP